MAEWLMWALGFIAGWAWGGIFTYRRVNRDLDRMTDALTTDRIAP